MDHRPNMQVVMMKNILHTGNCTLVIHPLLLTIIMAILAYNYVLRWLTMCILQNYSKSKLPIEICLKFKFVCSYTIILYWKLNKVSIPFLQ